MLYYTLTIAPGCFYSSGRWIVSTCFTSLHITVFCNTGINTSLSGWPMHTFFCQWSLKIFYHTIFMRPWVFSWWLWCLVRLWFCGGDAVVATLGWPHEDHLSPSTCMRSVTGLTATPHSLAPLWSVAWCTLSSWCPAAVLLLLLQLLLLLGVTWKRRGCQTLC